MTQLTILGITGSLRAGSFNMHALKAAQELCPEGAKIDIFEELGHIPLYNQDLENSPPAAVVELKSRLRAADAVLFATPEYNFSVPGVLKNAIDWASRPYGDNSFQGKPAAIIGASTSLLGTARAQYHLRQVMVFLDMHPVNAPEVMIAMANDRFDEHGKLTDKDSQKFITQLLENLMSWTHQLQAGAAAPKLAAAAAG